MQSRLLTIREQWLLFGVAGAIVLGAAVLLWRGDAQSGPGTALDVSPPRNIDGLATPPPALPAPDPPTPALVTPTRIAVGVLGAVQEPGLYHFESGARVIDLLEAAGGTLPECDLSDINRTALLIDETTLLVPEIVVEGNQSYSYPSPTYNPTPYTRSAWYQFEAPADGDASGAVADHAGATTAVRSGTGAGGRININTASKAELETLPGVGPATALKIIAYRENQPFTTPGDLERVSGIGPAKMSAVRGLITVE